MLSKDIQDFAEYQFSLPDAGREQLQMFSTHRLSL